jgi:hypothetical protein
LASPLLPLLPLLKNIPKTTYIIKYIAKNPKTNTTPDCENIFVMGPIVDIGILGENVCNGANVDNVDIYITTSYFFL